jgi:hypothetical protein
VETPLPTLTDTSVGASPSAEPATSTPGNQSTATAIPTTATSTTAPLTVTGIEPNSIVSGSPLILTITGTGFQSGATVTFEIDGVLLEQEIQTVQVISDTTIFVALIPENNGTEAQVWDVRVTNPDLTTFVLLDAFTVAPST